MGILRLFLSFCIMVFFASCHDASNNAQDEVGQEERTATEEATNDSIVPPSEGPVVLGPTFPGAPVLPDFWEREGAKRRGNHDDNICDDCIYAQSGFSSGPDGWYEIETLPYPTTTLLSQNGNSGVAEGDIAYTDTGITINESGTYWASINVILLNENEEYTPLIPLFLIRNNVFDPLSASQYLGTTVSVMPDVVTSVNTDGILVNVARGTTLSIVATNGGSPQPEDVTVVAWSISLFRICD